jgi:hypothetical protein
MDADSDPEIERHLGRTVKAQARGTRHLYFMVLHPNNSVQNGLNRLDDSGIDRFDNRGDRRAGDGQESPGPVDGGPVEPVGDRDHRPLSAVFRPVGASLQDL